MRKNDFIHIYDEIIKKAEEVIATDNHIDLLRTYDTYKSYLKQLTQILKDVEDKSDIKKEINSVKEVHNKVVERLVKEKDGLFKTIRTDICREHVRKKYNAKSQKSSLINKKT